MYNVLACGSNGKFQLGIDDDIDRDELELVKFKVGDAIVTNLQEKPRDIICGGNHSFILCENGDLYGCGDNSQGQLGLEQDFVSVFTQIPGRFQFVSAGWEFSIFVTSENEVYSCGQGMKGELGLGETIVSCRKLTKIPLDVKIYSIKSCMNHTIMSTSQGLYGWGVSKNGKLGITSEKILYQPTKLEFDMDPIEDYCIGRDFTVIKFANDYKIHGRFNYNQDFDIVPNTIIKSMWSSIHFLKNNHIISVGNNSHGQFYPGSDLKINEFTVGSEHGLIISNNQVYAWGWGEHGNCGKLKHHDVVVNQLQPIYLGIHEPIMIKGGLATSWVVVKINFV